MNPKKIVTHKISTYKKGLDLQREIFKAAKSGIGTPNFDQMCDAIENIKSEIKSKLEKDNQQKIILRIEKIIKWYKNIEEKATVMTQEGPRLNLPQNIERRINHNLTIAYELLIQKLDDLGLL